SASTGRSYSRSSVVNPDHCPFGQVGVPSGSRTTPESGNDRGTSLTPVRGRVGRPAPPAASKTKGPTATRASARSTREALDRVGGQGGAGPGLQPCRDRAEPGRERLVAEQPVDRAAQLATLDLV